MKCVKCWHNLQMTTCKGIEIDYCPQCRGVWLDPGELDEIMTRSAAMWRIVDDEHDLYVSPPRDQYTRYPKKRESFFRWLLELD